MKSPIRERSFMGSSPTYEAKVITAILSSGWFFSKLIGYAKVVVGMKVAAAKEDAAV